MFVFFVMLDPEAEAEAGMRFKMIYWGKGEGQVVLESVAPVMEMEGGNRRLGEDLCRSWD